MVSISGNWPSPIWVHLMSYLGCFFSRIFMREMHELICWSFSPLGRTFSDLANILVSLLCQHGSTWERFSTLSWNCPCDFIARVCTLLSVFISSFSCCSIKCLRLHCLVRCKFLYLLVNHHCCCGIFLERHQFGLYVAPFLLVIRCFISVLRVSRIHLIFVAKSFSKLFSFVTALSWRRYYPRSRRGNSL